MKIQFLLTLALAFVLSGCIKNNPDPSWLEIKEFTVEPNLLLAGAEGDLSSNGFTNGWVYVNEKFIGIFQLPCKVPILVTGQANVRVRPTILNNGLAATKKDYPFMDPYETSVNLVQNETATITPSTKYSQGTTFWIENFEESTVKIHDGVNTQTSMIVENIDGRNVGKVTLTTDAPYWSGYISLETDQSPFTFPLGSQIYLEYESKNDTAPIKTMCIWTKSDGTSSSQNYYGSSTATQGWKKMYIDYTETVVGSGGYAFYFGFNCTLPEGETQAVIYLDNIKLIYR